MEDKYLTVVEEHVDRLGEMAKNIQEVSLESIHYAVSQWVSQSVTQSLNQPVTQSTQ